MDLIKQKMAQFDTENMSAYLRKIAIDGFVIKLDMPELREPTAAMKRISANEKQIVKRLNENRRIYEENIEKIKKNQAEIYEGIQKDIKISRRTSVIKSSEGAQLILEKSFRGLGSPPTSFLKSGMTGFQKSACVHTCTACLLYQEFLIQKASSATVWA